MTSKEIRQKYLEFFQSKGHQIVPSAPIVLKNDPTLMFSNSGMTQFKDFFLGYKEPKSVRVADTQKCLRVSGKHNDLEDVGRDTYHHTMFEMLGNWSFGDYFKKEAIAYAWELLTEIYKIPKENLYVTIFEGDQSENLERDNDAYDYWKEFIDEERILNGNKKDNFWEMGEQGPCGPCSEIHIDIRPESEKAKISGKELVNKDHPQVVEIWNLVFMEFLRKANGSLEKLPKHNVDTGMGFERLCMALQGKNSNYDTDIFTPLISELEKISGKKYEGKLEDERDIAIRVIVDHVRAVAFSIADGQLPSNNGAGYVIRRILRRAIRYGFTFLDLKQPFIYQLVKILADQMGHVFPELIKQQSLIEKVIHEEESSFLSTLEQGLIMLDSIIKSSNAKKISGEKAFKLYDTYGFPIDLTALILSEKGFELDEEEFENQLKQQKERSRTAAQIKTDDWVILDDSTEEKFIGYDSLETNLKIIKYRKIESQKDGTLYHLVFDVTPFYPEGGGQVGDKGFIISEDNEKVEIIDTKKENNLIIHIAQTLPINLNAIFTAKVENREAVEANHSATHLLHKALRDILGTHVEQRGSKVDGDSLRFDFSHFQKLTDEELLQIEKQVNDDIKAHLPLQEFRNIPIQQAIDQGAMALFGEKYGDSVRMIQFGESRELCGGTHVKNTGEIWFFKILSEGAVAAGIRRIEAITKDKVAAYFKNIEKDQQEIGELLKTKEITKSVHKLIDENHSLKEEIELLKKEKIESQIQNWKNEYTHQNDINVLIKKENIDGASAKNIIFKLKNEVPNSVTIIISRFGNKPMISVGISQDLERRYQASSVIKDLAKEINGGGGGNPGFASAGGKNIDGTENAYQKAIEIFS